MDHSPNLIRALLRLGDKYHQEREKRFRLIGSIITAECKIRKYAHTARSFDLMCESLEAEDTDLLEAIEHAYHMQLIKQHEGAKAPVTETV